MINEAPREPHRHFDIPAVKGGDEPHYLVMLNSLMLDHDLDLKNNYASVHGGSNQAGRWFSGEPLDHHVVWFVGGQVTGWGEMYGFNPPSVVPVSKNPLVNQVRGLPEYGSHPPGLPLLLAPLLYPLRHTNFVEPAAIVFSTLAIILALLSFRRIVRIYTPDPALVNLVSALAFLGTPAWHYGRTLYTEPYLLCFAVCSYDLWLTRRQALFAGLLIGMGSLMKPPFGLLVFPLALDVLLTRGQRMKVLALAVGPLLAGSAFLYLNFLQWGDMARSSTGLLLASPWQGMGRLLFSMEHGWFAYAPVIAPALLGWPGLVLKKPRPSLVMLSAAILYFAFMACWQPQLDTNGWCYGSRHLLPITPFVVLGMVVVFQSWWYKHVYAARWLVLIVLWSSLIINVYGGVQHFKYWAAHPLSALLKRLVHLLG